jgi:hypothetical protein
MPELRQNFFTKEWVVITTERAKRPEQLDRASTTTGVDLLLLKLSLLPGERRPDAARTAAPAERSQGFGVHDVIVETTGPLPGYGAHVRRSRHRRPAYLQGTLR